MTNRKGVAMRIDRRLQGAQAVANLRRADRDVGRDQV